MCIRDRPRTIRGGFAPITATGCQTAARRRACGGEKGREFGHCRRKTDSMIRRIAFAAICLLMLATSASAQPGGDKLSNLQSKVNQATEREGVLTSNIASMNGRIQSLRSSVASAEGKLARLQVEVDTHEQRLGKVRAAYEQQSQLLALAQRQYDYAQH